MLQSLIERPGIADRKNVGGALAARPGQIAVLFDCQADLHLEAGLDAGADDLAVALCCVAVAEEEQRAGHGDREPHCRARTKTPVIHVAAVFGAGRGGKGLPYGWRYTEATDHRFERQDEMLQARNSGLQRRRQSLPVDPPVHLVARRQTAHEFRVDDIARKRCAGPAGCAYRCHAQDFHLERVARFSARHRDRTVHRVRLGRALHAVLVEAVGVDGLCDNRVARGDGEGGRQGAQHIVPVGGDKPMRCHGRSPSPTSQLRQGAWPHDWSMPPKRCRLSQVDQSAGAREDDLGDHMRLSLDILSVDRASDDPMHRQIYGGAPPLHPRRPDRRRIRCCPRPARSPKT